MLNFNFNFVIWGIHCLQSATTATLLTEVDRFWRKISLCRCFLKTVDRDVQRIDCWFLVTVH